MVLVNGKGLIIRFFGVSEGSRGKMAGKDFVIFCFKTPLLCTGKQK